ncbi:hypothetical protein A2Y99_01985 [Candidatus Gottesmanbacteria bacterium RBG_13_37_7]|uniref:Metallo-beta-lactamase domain-containing protein n=1 Tax=Candidatus Gottesmanbacteria bacterium RBG_13_37_7 TaxID=1798369 RepID=A0A1F5YHT4_9BACT|nr:MAG: hypothetical protein A2Y99_01985 [Candidatus Gottesmanbacteria bacterium RBG_13_37_7]
MEIIPLGTNGFFASFGRQTACYAIPYGNILILLDAGSGLFRLVEKEGRKLLHNAKEVHIFLSHYHLDHVFGFYAAFEILKKKKVTVFSYEGRKIFSELCSLNHFPIDYQKKHKNFSWKAIGEGSQKINSYQVSVKKQNHRGEVSLAFRFKFSGKKMTDISYVTDSEPTQGLVEFIDGTQILLCEHTESGSKHKKRKNQKLEDQILDGHTTSIGAAMIAKKAKIERLFLIHHKPLNNKKNLRQQLKIAKKVFFPTNLTFDLIRIKS